MSSLPPGWEQRRTQQGQTFYINHATKTTHWELPVQLRKKTLQRDDSFQTPDPLPPNWEQRRTANGQTFYINHKTKTTQWTRPVFQTANLDDLFDTDGSSAASTPPTVRATTFHNNAMAMTSVTMSASAVSTSASTQRPSWTANGINRDDLMEKYPSAPADIVDTVMTAATSQDSAETLLERMGFESKQVHVAVPNPPKTQETRFATQSAKPAISVLTKNRVISNVSRAYPMIDRTLIENMAEVVEYDETMLREVLDDMVDKQQPKKPDSPKSTFSAATATAAPSTSPARPTVSPKPPPRSGSFTTNSSAATTPQSVRAAAIVQAVTQGEAAMHTAVASSPDTTPERTQASVPVSRPERLTSVVQARDRASSAYKGTQGQGASTLAALKQAAPSITDALASRPRSGSNGKAGSRAASARAQARPRASPKGARKLNLSKTKPKDTTRSPYVYKSIAKGPNPSLVTGPSGSAGKSKSQAVGPDATLRKGVDPSLAKGPRSTTYTFTSMARGPVRSVD